MQPLYWYKHVCVGLYSIFFLLCFAFYRIFFRCRRTLFLHLFWRRILFPLRWRLSFLSLSFASLTHKRRTPIFSWIIYTATATIQLTYNSVCIPLFIRISNRDRAVRIETQYFTITFDPVGFDWKTLWTNRNKIITMNGARIPCSNSKLHRQAV